MEIKPIWISSINHLNVCREIIRTTPFWRKLIGFYKIPDNFPRINFYYVLPLPIVYFSKGKLTLDGDSLSYKSSNEKIGFLKNYSNLKNDLSFEIKRSDIKSIQWYQNDYALLNNYNIKWIRITCSKNVMDNDFLICADGTFMNKITANTENLFEMLNQVRES